ncbi:PRC-barrel domain-containing protein [Hufsiella ginkgonis]|uniref:PRC-barrel domain-containing protein n=1 Tax=Hufsiella ginkgonis TaxID=2695274 RepID=A0A7K1Y0B1_9SPHI|nr:PRC-barrel domain-containing protein [Hufsiella ginkgonis]MXV16665.1 hypothetical protein [Hufsiella ginkgonis]
MEEHVTNNPRLEELGGSDFEIKDGQPDVRGWEVKDETGMKIGDVEDLLFDPSSRKVRYLVVDTDESDLERPDDNNLVLIPIGLAELHESEDEVILPGILPEQLVALPPYEAGNVTPVFEAQTRSILIGAAVGDTLAHIDDDFYSHTHFDEEKFYGSRMANVPVEENFENDAAMANEETIIIPEPEEGEPSPQERYPNSAQERDEDKKDLF